MFYIFYGVLFFTVMVYFIVAYILTFNISCSFMGLYVWM